jgi:FMN phosphatase YigB (HAD superfamily)
LTATRDRSALFRNRRFRRQVFEALDEHALTHDGTPGLLSLDVFDTLLLRDGSSQVRRFGEIGARMAARAGPGTTAEDALIARHLGTRASYRAGPRVDGCGEGSLREIHETAARILGLPGSIADDFIEIEIDCECGHVEPNPLLVSYIRKHQARGGKTVLISDMYMHADQIAELLARSGIRPDLYDALYSSADTKVSKASGGIFRLVKEAEGAPHVAACGRQPARRLPQPPRRRLARDAVADPRRAARGTARGPRRLHRELGRAHRLDLRRGDRGMKTWTPKATKRRRPIWSTMSATTSWARWYSDGFWPCTNTSRFTTTGTTVALFCARAGVRIAELYDLFLRDRCAAGPPSRMFWVSRLAVAKGVFANPAGQKPSIELLTREYRHQPLRDLVTGIMRQCPDLLSDIDLRDRSLDAHGHNFAGWLTVNGPVSVASAIPDGEHRRLRNLCRRPAGRATPRAADRQRVAGHDTEPPDIRTSRHRLARSLFRAHPDA